MSLLFHGDSADWLFHGSPPSGSESWHELHHLAERAGVSVEHLCATVETATHFTHTGKASSSPSYNDDLEEVIRSLADDDYGFKSELETKSEWNEADHPRDDAGRFTDGASLHDIARQQLAHFPPEGILPGHNMWAGSFERSHRWQGDGVENESRAFQEGKAQALQKVLPFAKQGSQEAASVVLKADGTEFSFRTGSRDQVGMEVPREEDDLPAAGLHSHPIDIAHSATDWVTFLTSRNLLQSHVIGPSKTYSLHKPPGWKLPEGTSERDIRTLYQDATIDAFDEAEELGLDLDEVREREHILNNLARQFGVNQRIGDRR